MEFLVYYTCRLLDVIPATHMVDASLVEQTQRIRHAFIAEVSEVVVCQCHTIEKTIAKEFRHLFIASQVRANLFNLLCLSHHYRTLQIDHTVVVSGIYGFHVGKQVAVFSLLQKELRPVVDDQVAGYHHFYHSATNEGYSLLVCNCCCSGS